MIWGKSKGLEICMSCKNVSVWHAECSFQVYRSVMRVFDVELPNTLCSALFYAPFLQRLVDTIDTIDALVYTQASGAVK